MSQTRMSQNQPFAYYCRILAAVTNLSEGADEACQTDDSSISEQLGHLRDATDVLLPVLRTESEVLVEPVTNVVSIQAVRRNSLTHQIAFQRKRQRRLAGARQSCDLYTSRCQSCQSHRANYTVSTKKLYPCIRCHNSGK